MVVELRGEGSSFRENDAHEAMCQNSTEENNRRYKSMKNKSKKAVSKATRDNAGETLIE